MLSDPLSISIEGSVRSFARISSTGTTSLYRTADGQYSLTIDQSYGDASVTLRKHPIDNDPFNGGPVDDLVVGAGLHLVRNGVGYNYSSLNALRADMSSWMSDAIASRILAGEL